MRASGLPAWCKQRQRQNHFFGRDAAVQERPPIAALVLAELGWIDEEAIIRGEQRISARATTREPQHILAGKEQSLVGPLGAQILTELVAQIGAGVALGIDRRRSVAMNRAVIGRQQHGDASPRCFLQNAEQRRALEALPRYLAQRAFVLRDFL